MPLKRLPCGKGSGVTVCIQRTKTKLKREGKLIKISRDVSTETVVLVSEGSLPLTAVPSMHYSDPLNDWRVESKEDHSIDAQEIGKHWKKYPNSSTYTGAKFMVFKQVANNKEKCPLEDERDSEFEPVPMSVNGNVRIKGDHLVNIRAHGQQCRSLFHRLWEDDSKRGSLTQWTLLHQDKKADAFSKDKAKEELFRLLSNEQEWPNSFSHATLALEHEILPGPRKLGYATLDYKDHPIGGELTGEYEDRSHIKFSSTDTPCAKMTDEVFQTVIDMTLEALENRKQDSNQSPRKRKLETSSQETKREKSKRTKYK